MLVRGEPVDQVALRDHVLVLQRQGAELAEANPLADRVTVVAGKLHDGGHVDHVRVARVNLLLTFVDYYKERWGAEPNEKLLRQMTNKIVWNIWQMDGLNDTVPLGKPYEEFRQMSLFDIFPGLSDEEQKPEAALCKIYDWKRGNSLLLRSLKEKKMNEKKLFDFVIGNPPYQEQNNMNQRQSPVYHLFMDEAEKVSDVVELITPARFLFNAGQTPKAWNNKKLHDLHFKVLKYTANAKEVFSNTEIKGGVAVTISDSRKTFSPIEIFIDPDEMNLIFIRLCLFVQQA